MLLIVNGDDFGLTAGVCDAILRAHRHGVLTSTSALVVAPAFAAHAAALRDSGIGVGLHLAFVGEDPPVLSAGEVPTLVDRRGRLPLTWRAFLRRVRQVDPCDLRREADAQADLLASTGIRPSHVDAHQNLHLWAGVRRVALDVAVARQAPAVRVPRTTRWRGPAPGVRVLGADLARRARRRGIAVTDAAAGLDEAGRWDAPGLVATVERLAATGARSAEVATHPGTDPDPARERYAWGYRWAREAAALCDPEVRAAVRRCGATLGTYADLVAAGPTGRW